MKRPQRTAVRTPRLAHALVATALLFGVTACSSVASGVAPDADRASVSLEAGLKAHASGDLTAAVADYQDTLKYDDNNKFALYNLGLIDAANGNYGLAEEKYRAALAADTTYGPALFNLAILRTARGDSTEAIALYERAVAADATAASAWLNLGLLQRANGNQAAGDTSVSTAIGLDPTLKDPATSAVNDGAAEPSGTATP